MKKLVSTLGLPREEWLAYRKQGIGGSDAAAVVGLNPYSSPMKVYYDKTNAMVTSDVDNEAMRQGRDLEEYVAKRFTEETGWKVRRANAIYYDEKRPYMIADVDRLLVGGHAGLECKTVSPYSESKWDNGAIPVHYQLQCYHYMSVFDLQEWYIAALIFGRKFMIRKLVWNDSVIDTLRKMEEHFWLNHVQKHIMPEPDGSSVSDQLIAGMHGSAIHGSKIELKGFSDRLARRAELSSQIDVLETEKRRIEQEVKLYLGDHEIAEGEGYFVKWANVNQNRVDTERLKKEKPQIYQDFLKSIPTRRLTIKASA